MDDSLRANVTVTTSSHLAIPTCAGGGSKVKTQRYAPTAGLVSSVYVWD